MNNFGFTDMSGIRILPEPQSEVHIDNFTLEIPVTFNNPLRKQVLPEAKKYQIIIDLSNLKELKERPESVDAKWLLKTQMIQAAYAVKNTLFFVPIDKE